MGSAVSGTRGTTGRVTGPGEATEPPPRLLALLPFLVQGAMPLAVLRAMRERGMEVAVAYYLDEAVGLAHDPCLDFSDSGSLIDMTRLKWRRGVDHLESIVNERSVDLVLQIGSPWAYAQIPRLKERLPSLRIVDWLFNDGPHYREFSHRAECFDGVLVESRAMFSSVGATAGLGVVRQVESGVDLQAFRPSRGVKRRLLPGPLVVGYLGRLSPEKNPMGFVELAEAVLAEESGICFTMFGSGPEEGALRQRLQQTGNASIVYRGPASTAGAALGQMDVLVVPSRLDGRPAVVMEASAMGVPVIGAPVGSIPELIQDGVNGFVIAPTDIQQNLAALRRLRDDRQYRRALGRSARSMAEDRFDRGRMMRDYEAAFRAWVREPSRPVATLPTRVVPEALTITIPPAR